MLEFALATFLLLITPGPGVMSTAGMGAAYGFRPGMRYVIGLMLGQNIVVLFVVSGLAAVVLAMPVLRNVLLFASMGYLLYLASRIAFAGAKIQFIEAQRPPGVMAGLLLQPINPKAYVVLTALFTGFPFWEDAYWTEVAVKLLLLHVIWVPIHVAWLMAGVALERLNLPERTQRGINVVMALAMVAVVCLAVASTLRAG